MGRYAPSPTGLLHLGNARTALLAWLDARSHAGRWVMRVEDIDTPRCVPGMEARQLADLRWLGLDWDHGPDVGGPAGPYRQSERLGLYQEALERLRKDGRAYPCTCSRQDLRRAASAPHAGEEGPPYPGTCRGRFPSEEAARAASHRVPAWRFRVAPGVVRCADRVVGPHAQDVEHEVGDVVVRRADGLFAYQLAVVVDDAAMGVTHVVRAADLLGSTPRQAQLAQALGLPVPIPAHLPLLLGPDGTRLQKREPRHTLAGLRTLGVTPEEVVGWLAHSAGVTSTVQPRTARSLVQGFRLETVRDQANWSLLPGSVPGPVPQSPGVTAR
jgi:glutamyl-tRNA synthetase